MISPGEGTQAPRADFYMGKICGSDTGGGDIPTGLRSPGERRELLRQGPGRSLAQMNLVHSEMVLAR